MNFDHAFSRRSIQQLRTLPRFRSGVISNLKKESTIRIILYLCVFENFVLSIFNNSIGHVDQYTVIVVQIVITMTALIVAYLRRPYISQKLVNYLLLFLLFTSVSSLINGTLNAKFIYDVSLIPIFVMLGSTVRRLDISVVVTLTMIVLAVSLFELAFSDAYIRIVNPGKYFFSTRAWVSEQSVHFGAVSDNGADVYLGAYRSNGTTFGLSHRISSIFLEPLSLGYFAVVSSFFFRTSSALKPVYKISLIAVCLFLAGIADSRTGIFLIVVLSVFYGPLKYIRRDFVFAVPFILMASAFLMYQFNIASTAEMESRLGVTFNTLTQSSWWNILFGGIDAHLAGDSGIVYFIGNAGIFGYFSYIILASGALNGRSVPVYVVASAVVYLFVSSLFGYAFLSIKTACIFGYGIGALGQSADVVAPRAKVKRVTRSPLLVGPGGAMLRPLKDAHG